MFIDEVKTYLESVCNSHIDIASVHFGNDREITGAQLNNMVYPAAWIETPVIRPRGDEDRFGFRYEIGIAVINQNIDDTVESALSNQGLAQRIINQICFKIAQDIEYGILKADMDFNRINMELIFYATADNVDGIRCSFDLTVFNPEFCFDESKFEE